MKKPEVTPKKRIASVLRENANGYLTAPQIAEIAWGEAYTWDTRNHLNDKIRRNIYGAMAILVSEGFVVIGKKNKGIKGNPFDRWKIADEGDKDDVIIVLGERKRRAKGLTKSSDALESNAKDKGLLPDSETDILGS